MGEPQFLLNCIRKIGKTHSFFWFFFWPSETFVMRLLTRCCAADVPLWYPPWHRSDAIRMLQKTSWRGWRIWTQTDETRWSCDVSSPWVQASQSQWPPKLATFLWVMISRYRDDTWNWTLYLGGVIKIMQVNIPYQYPWFFPKER